LPRFAVSQDSIKKKQALLFVNKKKQKNFVLRAVATPETNPTVIRSFLLLFFKKEALS
jgi:hypothetical protein